MRNLKRFRSRLGILLAIIGLWTTAGLAQDPAKTAASPADTRQPYRLQRGDEVTIKVFNNPELLDTVIIRPDGMISLVLLDDVDAAGLTVAELDARLTAGYAKTIREPQVSVIVRGFANLRVYVGGEVGQPGPVSLRGDVTALEAILQVGGFRPTARLDSVILLRNDGKNTPLAQKIDFKELLAKGGQDVALQPFDVLYVPVSRIAKADRFVDQYIKQLLPISLTGGFTYLLGGRAVIVPQ